MLCVNINCSENKTTKACVQCFWVCSRQSVPTMFTSLGSLRARPGDDDTQPRLLISWPWDSSGCSGWPNRTTGSLQREKGGRRTSGNETGKRLDCSLLAVKMGAAARHGMKTSRNWTRWKKRFFTVVSKVKHSLKTPWFYPSGTHFGLVP